MIKAAVLLHSSFQLYSPHSFSIVLLKCVAGAKHGRLDGGEGRQSEFKKPYFALFWQVSDSSSGDISTNRLLQTQSF